MMTSIAMGSTAMGMVGTAGTVPTGIGLGGTAVVLGGLLAAAVVLGLAAVCLGAAQGLQIQGVYGIHGRARAGRRPAMLPAV